MKTLHNDRFLRALRRERVDRTPVWMMRQAGRYLPEYRATRARAGDFMALCRNPELCCEVTLQPLARFDLDAAILFSDILTIPDAMGLGLSFVEGEGPQFARPLRDAHDIERLPIPDPETELRYVMDAVRTIDRALAGKMPLIGFSGSPWTLATYMVEGAASREFAKIKKLMFDTPELLDSLLAKLAAAAMLYLEGQARAGVDALMIFDTWGGALAPADYLRFSLAPMEKIVAHLKNLFPEKPVILFTKNGGAHLGRMADSGADALGVDWTTDLATARAAVGDRVALQGNLDPCCLLAEPHRIEIEVARVLQSHGPGPGHVFNLGHGILPQTPPEHALVMVEAVKRLSSAHT